MERLPREVALDIFSRLPITSLQRLKCVSKLWHSLAKDPHLLFMYKATHKNPSLILHCDLHEDHLYLIESDIHAHFDITLLKLDQPFKSVTPTFDILGSCNGFLCLSNSQSPDTLHVYNPLTNESTQLPNTNKNFSHQRVVLGLGFSSKTKEFKVVRTVYAYPPSRLMGIGYIGYGDSDTSLYTLGIDDSWRSQGKAVYWLDGQSPTALVNESLHWLTQAHKYRQFQNIVSFDLATEKFNTVEGPSCDSLKRNWYTLVELGGCLGAVVRTSYYGQLEVWVMKEYKVRESWSKDYAIRAYSPVGFNPDIELSERMQKRRFWKRTVRVVCLLRNGEILLEYGNQKLVCYDPTKDEFKELSFDGLPNCFESVALTLSLVSQKGVQNNNNNNIASVTN
ncbi:hypothetical protein Syun_026854 [Stephania yunnanensis]|uniref:F-box domain-containing protein n=1 Tax=Stephania yunnanensis TaxID=152371 RepID=A0AAP0ELW0_9MAGN